FSHWRVSRSTTAGERFDSECAGISRSFAAQPLEAAANTHVSASTPRPDIGWGRVHGGCHACRLDSTPRSAPRPPVGTPVCGGYDKATSELGRSHQLRFFRSRRSRAGRRRGSSPLGKIWVFWTFWVPVLGNDSTKRIQPGALK